MIYRNSLKKNAFTLAETMIVIVVLGIIATLTIPALVNKNKESVAKTKVRKAMAAYESALNKMVIENDLKDNKPLTDWAGNAENNCANSTNYFKKVQGDGCIFKTSDGIWWDISDIERPLIAFKQDDLTTEKANAANDYSAFVLVGRFGNDGSLRVDDLAYETANSVKDVNNYESKVQVEKLYKLLGLKSTSGGGSQSPFAACKAQHAQTCIVNGVEFTLVALTNVSNIICTYNEETDEENCDNISTSYAGEYYMVDLGIPDGYDEMAHDYTGSTCTNWCHEGNKGDYYNAAIQKCKAIGANLANASEMESLANQGKLAQNNGFYFVSDEYSTNGAIVFYSYDDGGWDRDNGSIKSDKDGQVLCIGNE